ncbi:hypothetical protein [Methylocella sp. CPCC 101449]|uniref:hypothetical protein n=1 Tax=Methylocella sp. CPCC 101449 TaxID=2987531 RepID=UPI00288D14C5|nr:hypothetical protein [Methylocella sp. CPCC 101449]MDT2020889.1 hypothetical protein [Methylocella sp. CPCC 101449]
MTKELSLDPLIGDLVEWVAREPRTYADVLDAWRTSCPRLTVWEDAIERGLLARTRDDGTAMISVTDAGRQFLATRHVNVGAMTGAALAKQ